MSLKKGSPVQIGHYPEMIPSHFKFVLFIIEWAITLIFFFFLFSCFSRSKLKEKVFSDIIFLLNMNNLIIRAVLLRGFPCCHGCILSEWGNEGPQWKEKKSSIENTLKQKYILFYFCTSASEAVSFLGVIWVYPSHLVAFLQCLGHRKLNL